MWDSIRTNNKKAVYRHIVTSNADVNAVYGQTSFNSSLTLAKAMLLQEQSITILDRSSSCIIGDSQLKASSMSSCSPARTIEERNKMDECFEGCSLLHLACQTADIGMIELLLQYGANVNGTDLKGRTPLHHCVLKGRHSFAKLLLSRYASCLYSLVLLVFFRLFLFKQVIKLVFFGCTFLRLHVSSELLPSLKRIFISVVLKWNASRVTSKLILEI